MDTKIITPFVLALFPAVALGQNRPNVLIITSEDNSPDLGCYGAPISTPVLDSLASAGVMFERAYCPQAGSSPGRACLLTGLNPHENGQIGLSTWKYHLYDESCPNIINSLKAQGYHTGMVGKLHILPEEAFSIDFHKVKEGNFKRNKMERYANFSREFILGCGDEPFYLQVNYPDTHEPFIRQVDGRPEHPLSAEDVEVLEEIGVSTPGLREQTANYYNCMMRLDSYIGDLLRVLKETGKADNTIVIYVADHGADLIRGKRSAYDGGLRVAFIASWPGHWAEGKVYRGIVSTTDIYPTVLKELGLKVPGYLPGKPLSAQLRGSDKPLHDYLFQEYNVHSNHNPYPQRIVRDSRYKLIWNPLHGIINPGVQYTLQIRDQVEEFPEALKQAPQYIQDAYALSNCPPEFELYDLSEDPYEFHNLAEDEAYGKVKKRLVNALRKWQKQSCDPFLDPALAFRFFCQVKDVGLNKVYFPYPEYMDPHLDFRKYNYLGIKTSFE